MNQCLPVILKMMPIGTDVPQSGTPKPAWYRILRSNASLVGRHGSPAVTMTMETQLGRIDISPIAVASIASQVVLQSYGVVGMVSKSVRNSLIEKLAPGAGYRGVDVRTRDGQITIDLYVILEYGVRISEVARNIMAAIKFRVERTLGMPVAQVNIHIQGLRISGVVHDIHGN
jgi:uncharacterized alkaline shock family protein YloU